MITEKKHHKHGDLIKPSLGQYARNEFAVYGTTCEEVERFVGRVRKLLPDFNVVFADADHHEDQSFSGTHWQVKSNSVQFSSSQMNSLFDRRHLLNDADLVIVNGNHFSANHQIIICNPEKENSLKKRVEQLTNVQAVFTLGNEGIPKYVRELIPDNNSVSKFQLDDDNGLVDWLNKLYLKPAPVKGLILTGGRSIRMGTDKALMNYHGEPQFKHVSDLMVQLGVEPYISCRDDQRGFYEDHGCKTITDRISGLGPMGGMISAFMQNPDHAWLVLACDLPLLDIHVLQFLMARRKHQAMATSFQSPHDKFPEPLIALWEPKSYARLLQFIAQGTSCPRKVLINSNTEIIAYSEPDKLTNVNTRDDLEDVFPDRKMES